MAFLFNDQDEEEKRKAGEAPQVGNTGEGGPAAGQSAGQSSGAPSAQRQFVDINAYLDANKSQTGDLADKVAGSINQAGDKLRGDITAARGTFDKQVDDNASLFDENFFKQATDNPADFIKNPDNVNRFTRMRTQQYNGPQELADVAADLPGKVEAERSRYKQDVDTSAGRKQFLQGLYPGSTPGMLTLDEALLGGNPEARQKLSGAAGQFDAINQFLGQQTGEAHDKAQQAAAGTEAARNTTSERLGGALTNMQSGVDANVAQKRTAAQTRTEQLKKLASSGAELSAQDLQQLGVTPEQWNSLRENAKYLRQDYGQQFNYGDFFNEGMPDELYNRETVASPDDYARADALAKLAGQDSSFLNQGQIGKAGTAPDEYVDFGIDPATGRAKDRLSQGDQELMSRLTFDARKAFDNTDPNYDNRMVDRVRAALSGQMTWGNALGGGLRPQAGVSLDDTALNTLRASLRQGRFGSNSGPFGLGANYLTPEEIAKVNALIDSKRGA